MTQESSPCDDGGADEQQLCEWLDEYLHLPPAGRQRLRVELREKRPASEQLLDCLDRLDQLAPEPLVECRDASSAGTMEWGMGEQPAASVRELPGRHTFPRPFGKYELVAELGRGGMGVVFKAHQKDLGRPVALKMILAGQLASPESVRRFYDEARSVAGLRHPHIVAIHEVGEVHGQHYFAMDFIAGRGLNELLRAGPLSAEAAASCVKSIADAVHFLHRHGMIHRDLKPANILVEANGHPYLLDFGLAKPMDRDSTQSVSGAIVGTPGYMSPEQAAGRNADISPRSDVYGLGAILYELLCGQPPFQGNTPLDILLQVIGSEPQSPRRVHRAVPRELELICLRCLEKNPVRRYASAADLAADLDRFLKHEPVDARPSGLVQRFRRWYRREPAFAAHAAGLAAMAAVVQFNCLRMGTDLNFHLQIMSIFAVWVMVAWIFQRLLRREAVAPVAQFGWVAADALLITQLLHFAANGYKMPIGPLLIGYPLLVAGSSFFFRVRLVLFTTGMCLASYLTLVWMQPFEAVPPYFPVVFGAGLLLVGCMVALQVHRVRVLSRYFQEAQRWP